jgi:hypothetical protein
VNRITPSNARTNKSSATLVTVPNEIYLEIIRYCTPRDIIAGLRPTCRTLRDRTDDDEPTQDRLYRSSNASSANGTDRTLNRIVFPALDGPLAPVLEFRNHNGQISFHSPSEWEDSDSDDESESESSVDPASSLADAICRSGESHTWHMHVCHPPTTRATCELYFDEYVGGRRNRCSESFAIESGTGIRRADIVSMEIMCKAKFYHDGREYCYISGPSGSQPGSNLTRKVPT